MTGIPARFVAVTAALACLGVSASSAREPHSTARPPQDAATAPAAPARCPVPAPATAAGYSAMFATLSPAEWGAADVSISTPLPDGRVLWLYGDTFRGRGFVHSSAVVQDQGCLHVVNGGAQLLPNIDAHHVYWIDAVRTDPFAGIVVTARQITLTGTCAWCFRDAGRSQMWDFEISSTGDTAGGPWPLGPSIPSAAPDPGPMYGYGPHHFGYARHPHPEIGLRSGRTLMTTCQNWDDGGLHPLAAYRPIFTEGQPNNNNNRKGTGR